MTVSSADDVDGPQSWLASLLCCAPLASCLGGMAGRSKSTSLTTASISWPIGRTSDQDLLIHQEEKDNGLVISQQPTNESRPVADPELQSSVEMERPARKSFASHRTVSTLKKRFRSDGSTRRPRISGPSDFRHVQTGSFQFPPPEPPVPRPRQYPQTRRSSFRPLELSIYMPDKDLSPMLPYFEFPSSVAPPKQAHLQERLNDDHELIRHRSNSSTPFHLPRNIASGSVSGSDTMLVSGAPAIPMRSQARARAHTSPELETIKARVAGAMIEVERLQKQIDDVVERQSIYASSRPSTAHSMAHTMPELEPMPSIPALPPAAPSFAERLNSDFDRPQTAPLKTEFEISNRSQEFGEAMSPANSPTYATYEDAPPPPLPLVLRPPLRKKKSFSRVSTWLFPKEQQHNRDLSLDSLTNLPRPIKGTEGFYQCVAPGRNERHSFESVGSVTTWDSEEEPRTGLSTLSPDSTPVAKQGGGPGLERTATFGKNTMMRPSRPIVGPVV